MTTRPDDYWLEWFRNELAQTEGSNYETQIDLALREFVILRHVPL